MRSTLNHRKCKLTLLSCILLSFMIFAGCGEAPKFSQSSICVPWTIGDAYALPGTDTELPGIESGTISILDFGYGPDKKVSIVIWSDLGSGSGSGRGESTRTHAYCSGTHLSPVKKKIHYQCETTDGEVVRVIIEGQQFDTTKGSLFLVSTKGDKTQIEQQQIDFDLATLRDLVQKRHANFDDQDKRLEISKEIQSFAIDSEQITNFYDRITLP